MVRAPDGTVLVDRYLRAPGRGAHLHYDSTCIVEASRRRAYARAFKAPVEPADPLQMQAVVLAGVTEAIAARIRDGLALARRASAALSGADALAAGWSKVRLLVLANDVATGTAERLRRRAHATGCPVVTYDDAVALGATQGRSPRVAVGVTDASIASRLTEEFARRDRVLVAAQS